MRKEFTFLVVASAVGFFVGVIVDGIRIKSKKF